jgi:predicted transposase/invertase (TIGR01784 family)
LVVLLAAVLKKDGSDIVRAILDRLLEMQKLPKTSKAIEKIEDLMEVASMFEANTKKWEESVFERGIKQGIERGIEQRDNEIIEKMVVNGINASDIHKITGASLSKIEQIRMRVKV